MTPNPSITSLPEGTQRERLAAYFLSAPPPTEQTPTQRLDYMSKLRQLGELEEQEVLHMAGSGRPLVWGNPVPHLQSLLTAAQHLAAGVGQPILVFPAKETAIDFDTLLHPRLLSMAMMGLLRLACLAAPKRPVWVRLREQDACLTVSVIGEGVFPSINHPTLSMVQESARLHGGSLALSDNMAGFSCGRIEAPPHDARPYRSPSAEELLRDTLSAVWTGFYGWLSPHVSGVSSEADEAASEEGSSSGDSS